MNQDKKIDLLDSGYEWEWDHNLGQPIAVKGQQEIDNAHLDRLKDLREGSLGRREGEYMHVASIPAVLVDKWLREGFNIFERPAKEIVARLKKEHLDHFMATKKSL